MFRHTHDLERPGTPGAFFHSLSIFGTNRRRAALMRINIWIVLALLLALLAITRFARYERDRQRICVDDPSASVCAR
jgi:hypothetical protein